MSERASGSPQAAFPWALLWFGVIALGAWVPLFLAQPLGVSRVKPTNSAAPATSQHLQGRVRTIGTALQSLPILSGTTMDPKVPIAQSFAVEPAAWSGLQRTPPGGGSVTSAVHAGGLPVMTVMSAADPAPISTSKLTGSVLLGGPLTLANLHEKAMVPAALAEKAWRAGSADRLAALPLHWRKDMNMLLQGANQVLPAEVVRLPAIHRRTAEEIPLALKHQGPAETTVLPSSQRSQAMLEGWTRRQEPLPAGQVRPVLVVLEPITADVTSVATKAPEPEGGAADQSAIARDSGEAVSE